MEEEEGIGRTSRRWKMRRNGEGRRRKRIKEREEEEEEDRLKRII